MHADEIIGYTTLDGEITCPDCTETQCDGSIPEDAPPIFADAEFDTPAHCSICRAMLDGQSLTRAGRRYVAKQIAEYIADDRGDCDTLALWSDLTDRSYSSTDLELARDCFASIGGTYSHGTLRPQDLLEAAIDAAQALHDWIACTPAYHGNDTSMCADLQSRMADAEQAIARDRAFWETITDDDDAPQEEMWSALESLTDAIAEHLPPPLTTAHAKATEATSRFR
jgi:hypothetical protein